MEERTPEIAIEYLEHYKKVKYGMMPEWVWDTAIEALKQESMQVELEGSGYATGGYAIGELVYDYGKCPKCGWEFEDGDKDWKEPYCCHCGQKLHWFESEDKE